MTIFTKVCSIFTKIRPVGAKLMHVDGQKDMTKLMGASCRVQHCVTSLKGTT
jgi:hypothetical protein